MEIGRKNRRPLFFLVAFHIHMIKNKKNVFSCVCPPCIHSSSSKVKDLSKEFPQLVPLTLILKRFLAHRNLDDPYTGGLSSYGLFLMVTFLLLRQRRINQQTAFILKNKYHGGHMDISAYILRHRFQLVTTICTSGPFPFETCLLMFSRGGQWKHQLC
jgi:hypothetical protein